MAKCKERCEIFCRVCGYFRPINNFNKGRLEEFRERKNFNLQRSMKKYYERNKKTA